jgi:hypothetical protein
MSSEKRFVYVGVGWNGGELPGHGLSAVVGTRTAR